MVYSDMYLNKVVVIFLQSGAILIYMERTAGEHIQSILGSCYTCIFYAPMTIVRGH